MRPHPGSRLKTLRLYTDGAARGNPGPAALGVVIEDDQGMRLRGLHRFLGKATNNEAEYEALIEGLKAVSEWKPDRLEIFLDSKLVVEQVNGRWKVKEARLQSLQTKARELLAAFPEVEIKHVERERNKGADALANMALDEHVKKPKAPG
ncbi:MAG TPA: ribonuclease HI family protein [Candidatus Dormibacteraeota bacterium]